MELTTTAMANRTSTRPAVSSGTPNIIKICRVCGDRAIGFNFNGLTCESCKSFFRRNAQKYEKYFCRKDNNCLIDFVTRKCCTKCRLDKCFSIGMKRELICSKMEKDFHGSSSSSSNQSVEIDLDYNGKGVMYKNGSPMMDLHCHLNAERLLDMEIKSKLSICANDQYCFSPSNVLDDSIDFLELSTQNSIPFNPNYYIELNHSELELIHEIREANVAAEFYDVTEFKVVGEVNDLIYALNLADLYIRKTIKFCKSLSAFRKLNQDDQLIILKDFFTDMMIIRFGFVYDPIKEAVPVIEDEKLQHAVLIKLNILYEAKKQDCLYYARSNLNRCQQEFEHDTNIRDIILAQQLFKPTSNTSCPEYIRYQHCIYTRLLNRYLEDKYKDVYKALEKFQIINQLLSELIPGRGILESIILNSDRSQLALLINEIYNQ